MSDILFAYWMISGTILSLVFLAISKQPMLSVIAGFLMAPMLPIVIIYAAINTYLESKE